MKNASFLTKSETEFPIGDSGLFFRDDVELMGEFSISSVEQIFGPLYQIDLVGLRVTGSDEVSTDSETYFERAIFNLLDQSLLLGYCERMSEKLFAIININSIFLGWPADDLVTIRNIVTNKKTEIVFEAPADEEFIVDKDLFVFTGSLAGLVEDNDNEKLEEKKRWRAFVNKEGRIVYQGFCWEYQLVENNLIIQKEKNNKRVIRRTLN